MRWSEARYLSQIVLSHALRQVSVSLIFDVGRNGKVMHGFKFAHFLSVACLALFAFGLLFRALIYTGLLPVSQTPC